MLALSGGLMDAYSYLARGKVFANAQTGNMLLLGIALADGRLDQALRYLLPVLSFALGISVTQVLSMRLKERRLPLMSHWRQIALLLEIVLLGVVAFVPEESNALANTLTSLACGIQVQAFRKIHGRPFATTMCIGNLRSGTHALIAYLHAGRLEQLRSAGLYYATIGSFVVGAIVGGRLIEKSGLLAILGCPVLLLVALGLMGIDRERRERRGQAMGEAQKRVY